MGYVYRNGVKVGPTTHHERYRIIWRHKWQIDENTNAIWQYYKIHDYDILNQGFLKTYFPREYQQNAQDTNLDTYFLLTRNMPHGTLTFNIDTSRVNRPLRGIERLPEVQYTLNNQQIGKTGFYAKSTQTPIPDLTDQNYPKTFNNKTQRFDSNNDISHPLRSGLFQFNSAFGRRRNLLQPYGRYQSSIISSEACFRGSLDMSTKFYRVWDYHTNFMGLNINGSNT